MKTKISFIIIFLLLLLQFQIPAHSSNNTINILVIYGTSTDREKALDMIPENESIIVSTYHIDNDSISFSDVDITIIASSVSFSFENEIEDQLNQFISSPDNYLVILSAFLDDFSGDIRSDIGIDDYIDDLGEYGNTSWTFELENDLGQFNSGDNFEYSGKIGHVNILSQLDVLVQATNSTLVDEDEIEYPIPIMWNLTSSSTLVGAINLGNNTDIEDDSLSIHENIFTDQFPDFFTFLSTVVTSYIQTAGSFISNLPSPDDEGGNNPNLIFSTIQPIYILIAAIFSLAILFFRRIIEGINWIIRKSYGLFFVIIGAFYNIQDRALNYNDVMMNTSRMEIIDFLHHVGEFGAHLREIKSITNMGSGSLLWHLQVLEDFNLITKEKVNSFTVFISSDFINQFDSSLKEKELNLQSKYTLPVLEVLNQYNRNDKVDLSTIEEDTGINRRSLRRLVKKLESENLVELEKTTSISVIILNQNHLRKIYQSLRLRNNFEWSEESIQIERMD